MTNQTTATYSFYLINGPFQDFEFVSETEFWNMELVNQSYSLIKVKDEQAASEWQSAYARYESACWEPNQSYETKEENGKIMTEMWEIMNRLEAEAK